MKPTQDPEWLKRMAAAEDNQDVSIGSPEPHPEDYCQRCGRPNIVWFTDNELWNLVMPNDGILCPVCFAQAAEAVGIKPTAWCVTEENPKVTALDKFTEHVKNRNEDLERIAELRDALEGVVLHVHTTDEGKMMANAKARAALAKATKGNQDG